MKSPSNRQVEYLPRLRDYSKEKIDRYKTFFRTDRSTSENTKPIITNSQKKIFDFLNQNNLRHEDRMMIKKLIENNEKIAEIIVLDKRSSDRVNKNSFLRPISRCSPQIVMKTEKQESPSDSEDIQFNSDSSLQSEELSSENDESPKPKRDKQIQKAITSIQGKLLRSSNESFFKYIKQQDKLKDLVQNFKNRDTLNPIYYYCQNDDVFPKRIDLEQFLIDEKELNLSDLGISVQYIPLLSNLLKSQRCKNVKQIKLNNNQLNEKTLKILMECFPTTLKNLNLSNNDLGKRGALILSSQLDQFANLKVLNLQKNLLGDIGTIALMNVLQKSHTLLKLNLSENQITDSIAKTIYDFLTQNSSMEVLQINWNLLGSDACHFIGKGLNQNRFIRVLDLSYNRLGLNSTGKAIDSWCQAIVCSKFSLVHLDLSYNQFDINQLQQLNQALNKNTNLYGLHIEGNKCQSFVDPYGFIQFLDYNDSSLQQVQRKLYQIDGVNYIPFTSDQIAGKDCCWICQGWSEQKFLYTPDIGDHHDPIFLHLDFMNYRPISMTTSFEIKQQLLQKIKVKTQTHDLTSGEIIHQMKHIFDSDKKISMATIEEAYNGLNLEQKQNEEISKEILEELNTFFYTTFQMCPPKQKIFYFYSNPLKEEYFIDFKAPYIQTPIDDLILQGKDPRCQIHKFSDGTQLQFKKMPAVNYLTSSQQFIIDDKNNYKPIIKVFPRSSEKKYVLRKMGNLQARKKLLAYYWRKEESSFRLYIGDSEQLLNSCFEFDWNCSKISRFVKNEYEKNKLKEYIRQSYPLLKDIYKYYSSFGYEPPQFDIFCIQYSQCPKILKGIIDGEYLTLQDIELDITSIKNNPDPKFIYNPEKALIRYQFMEMFFRLANDKYMRTSICKNFADAVYRLLSEVEALYQNFDLIQTWRDQRFWSQECDLVLTFKMPYIKKLYDFVTDITNRKWYFRLKWVSIRDYLEFCKVIGINKILNEKVLVIIYNFSMQTQVDEITLDRNIRMNYQEFIECLARLAEIISPAPIGENVEHYDRLKCNLLPLYVKLESFLTFIYYKLNSKIDEYELFTDLFAKFKSNDTVQAKDCMPKIMNDKQRKSKVIEKKKKEFYKFDCSILTVYNCVQFQNLNKQPYLHPDYEKLLSDKRKSLQVEKRNTAITVPSMGVNVKKKKIKQYETDVKSIFRQND